MHLRRTCWTIGLVALLAASTTAAPEPSSQAPPNDAKLQQVKQEVAADIDSRREFTQQMVDSIFSFSELGFQEFETSKYVTDILRENGFTVEDGLAGIPTAWMASWGSGKPVIALGTDIDGIPQSSQKPGVAYHEPLIEGAPGHGEGHNSGQAVIVTAALAVKQIMEREGLQGTLRLWPGVAEEQLGTKAYYVRAGAFKDVDIVLYSHVSGNLGTGWGDSRGNGLVSMEFMFEGQSAHSAGSPWRGRSALDAVELMNIGMNFRREHLRIQQRTHYVITNGGDQPNVVPPNAGNWYYLRESSYEQIKNLWDIAENMAKGAALMSNTTVTSRVLGSAWPSHMNKTIAETIYANIERVGLPTWTDDDIALAKATQRMMGVPEQGLATELQPLGGREHIPDDEKRGGGSDDIGDISWNVPTATLRFPSNFRAGPGHHWSSGIAMATPIAHKGATAGAKVHAMTILDFLMRPELVQQAWDYFNDVQTKDRTYTPLIRPQDEPAIWLNKEIMDRYRPEMRKNYYDPTQHKTYLEQLGIDYPVTDKPTSQQ